MKNHYKWLLKTVDESFKLPLVLQCELLYYDR
jgi:hypothetical protein